jgi:prephenate dehydratase
MPNAAKISVAIQGVEGSFHHEAALDYFGKDIAPICCDSFIALFEALKNNQAQYVVMAIENSLAGSILPNYRLLEQNKVGILGEIYLPIGQHLMANPGTSLKDVKEVRSHYMALHQCSDYLKEHHWKLIEADDTAASAKYIAQHHNKHTAAIASKTAAQLYGLKILQHNIQQHKENYTRFLILAPQTNSNQKKHNKATLSFITHHTPGSLAKVLTTIAANQINLSKLQSMPIEGSKFKYKFYADVQYKKADYFNAMLTQIKPITQSITVFGNYQSGI